LKRGEILGIGGLTNCGMHDLGKRLFGIEKPDSGKVNYYRNGKENEIQNTLML
jgi:ABC-type sugar transport system ATPase subunit